MDPARFQKPEKVATLPFEYDNQQSYGVSRATGYTFSINEGVFDRPGLITNTYGNDDEVASGIIVSH